MTLTIYLPPGAMTLARFRDLHPVITHFLEAKDITLAVSYWDEASDVAGRPPGVVLYNSVCTSTSADVMARVCEANVHLCLYHNELILPDRTPIKGPATLEFVAQWLQQIEDLAPKTAR